jgi:hypothetical protein
MLAARLLGELQFGLSNLVGKVSRREAGQRLAESRLGAASAHGDDGNLRAQRHALSETARRPEKSELEAIKTARLASGILRALDRRLCAPQIVDADSVWRVKGSSGLSRTALAVLRELWHWREREALRANRAARIFYSEPRKNGRHRLRRGRERIRGKSFVRPECRRAGATA